MTPPLHLDEQTSAASGVSPGPVADGEFLLREMFNPQHVKNDKLLPSAIPLQDLRSRGFSVHRMDHTSRETVGKSMKDRLFRPRKGDPWRDEGVAKFKTLTVRRLLLDGQQVLVVIDTASVDHPGHAGIYAADPERGDAYARELRSLLLPLLQKRVSIKEAFG